MLSLKVGQIDIPHRVIQLEPGTTKNNSGREVVMTEAVHQLLSSCILGKDVEGYFFARPNGKPVRDFRVWVKMSLLRIGARRPARYSRDMTSLTTVR